MTMAQRPRLAASQDEPRGTEKTAGGNGNGTRFEHRLTQLEVGLVRIETKLDTELKHLATRAWVLGGALASAGLAAGLVVAAARFL